MAQLLTARARQAHEWLARGFATWIDAGVLPPDTPPETLAIRFRAMVSGLQLTQHLDAASLTERDVVAALELALGVPVAAATT